MTKKKPVLAQIDKSIIITGIIAITILECFALHLGFNGTLLKSVLIVLAIAIGITIPKDMFIKK